MGKAKFDYLGAKRDGYSDEEIQSYLEKSGSNFDLISAKKDGYSDEEIDSYLADNFSVGEVKKKETAAPTSTKAPVQSSAQSSPSSVSNKAVGSSQSSGAAQQKSSGGVVGYFKNMIQSANEGVKIEEEETKEQLKPVTQKLSKGNIGGEGVGAYLSGRAFAPKATKEQKSFAARKIVDRMAPSGLDEETRVKITEQVTPLIRDEDAFKVAKDEEDKAFVASAGYQDILAKNDQLLEKANRSYGRENAIAAVEQSRTGKVARFLTAALNGETINPQDEAYLMKYANPAYKQILASKKVNNLAEYAALRKPEVDQLRIQAAQQEVWPQIAQFKDVKGIGTELTTMPDYAKKLNEQEQKEIDAIGNKYPLQVERPVGFEGGMEAKYNYTTKRDSRYDKEVAQIKNKYQEQRDKAGLADAISFAANQYKTKQGEVDPLKVGEQMLKTTNPVLYAVYAKGGKKSKDFQQNLYKAGVDVMRNSGVPQLYAVAQEKEKQYDKLYPEAKEKDVIIKLAIEKFKRQGGAGTWVNSEFIEFDEGDELAKNLPAPLKAAWERVKSKSQYRSYNMAASQPMYGVATENYNRVKIPPIGGGINEFYNGLVSPIEGIANTIAGVFDSKEQSANKALQNNWIKQKLVDRDAIQSEIKQIESKKTLTTEDAKNLIELKSQLGLKSKGQEYVDLGMFTTGQVFGQGGLSSAGGRLVSNIAGKFLPSLSNFSKLEKGATWLKDIGNASKLAGAEVAYLSSYGDAKIEANRLMPDANEGWKMLYANIVGFANAGTEHIFPDQKILDALKKEVSPSIAALVNNLSRGNITEASFNSSLKSIFKNAFTKYLPQVVIEGRKEDLEELTTAIVTTGGKGFMVAMGAMDESQLNFDDEVEGWKQTIQQSAIGGAVPSVLGGISEVRRNTITKNTLYNLSKDPTEMDKLSDVIRYQQETGVMSERDAIDKLQTVSMLKDIGQRAMPVINEKVKLTEPDKAQLTTLLLAENKLQDQIANPNYKDVKSVLEGQLAEVQKQKDAIINGKVVIDDDLNAYTPEEWAKKNKAETQATQESSAAVTDLLNKQKQAKDDYIARNGNPKTKSEVEAYNNFQTEIATKEGVDTYLKNAAAAPQQAAATPTNKGIAIVTNTDGTFDVVKENGEKENFKTQQEADARVLELSQQQPEQQTQPAAEGQAADQKLSPLQQLKQKKDAVQEQSTEGVDVRQQARNGEAMAEGNAKEQAATEEGEPAKGEETISSRVDEAVTIQVGGKAITGVVRQDEGGKLTVESGGKVIEVDNETPFVDYASPVRIADDGSGIEIGGEVFGEVSYETENGQEVALAKRADGTFKKITTPEIIEEIKYQGALKRLDEVSDTEAYRINKQYESERKTPQPAKEGTDKGDGGLRGPSQKAEKGQPAATELTDEERKLQEALDELDLIEKMADEELAQVESQAKLVEVIPTGSKQPKAYLVKKNKDGKYSATKDGRKVKEGAFLTRLGEAYEAQTEQDVKEARERLKQQVADLKEEVEAKFYGREPKKKEAPQAAPKSEEQVQQAAPAKQSPLQQIKAQKESVVSEKTDKEAFGKNTKQYKQSKGKKYGRKFKKKLPNGETVTGRYILVNKNDIFPSHDAKTWGKKKGVPLNEQGNTFNDNDYEKSQTARQVQREIASRYDRQAIDEPVLVDSNGVVKSGNGRTISRQLSTKESAKEYLDDLRDEAANFGFTEEDIDAIGDENVMLAVELDGAPVYNTQEYAKFNAQKEKTKTPLQKARELSKRVSDVTINKIAKIIGDKDKIADLKNSEMLSLKKLLMDEELINKFNQDTYFDEKNNLTEAGKEFIDGLLLASVFDEQELEILSKFKHIRNRLARVKLLLAKNTQKGELSVLNDIKSAIRFINKVDPSQSDYAADINNYVAQYDIFEEKQIDRNDVIWAVFMHSQKDLEAALDAVNSVNREIDLWGDKETRDSAIDRAIQSVVNSEGYSNEKKQIIQYAKQQEQNRKNIQQREAERAKVGGSVEEREPKIGEGNIGDIQDNGREGEGPQLSASTKSKNPISRKVFDKLIERIKKAFPKSNFFSDERTLKEKLAQFGYDMSQFLSVWHGSPYDFDRFSTEKIGTGEGAQAFGWGLYFTDVKDIADAYAKMNKQNLSFLRSFESGGIRIHDLWFEFKSDADGVIKNISDGYYDRAIAVLEKMFDGNKNELSNKTIAESLKVGIVEQNSKIEQAIQGIKNGDFTKTGQIYKASLHKGKTPDQYNWLEWDKPITQKQRNSIIEQAKKEGIYEKLLSHTSKRALNEDYDGVFWYGNISNALAAKNTLKNDKEASLFLLRAGLGGIKYPAESIARGTTSDTARGFNYVVFDENAVTIEEKIQFYRTPKGVIYGAKFPDGSVYINPEYLSAETPIHEAGHLWEAMFPKEWAEGVALFKDTTGFKEALAEIEANEFYDNLTLEQKESEALNTLIGRKGEGYYKSGVMLSRFKAWMDKFFKTIGDKLFGITGGKVGRALTADDKLSFFVNEILGDVMGGKEIFEDNQIEQENKGIQLMKMPNGDLVSVKKIDVDVINGFYSPLEKVISEIKFEKLPAKQWLDKFAKGEEAKWTGLQDWLAQQQGSVSKQDILNYLKENRISVVEVVKGGKSVLERRNELIDFQNQLEEQGDYAGVEAVERQIQNLSDDSMGGGATKFYQYQLEGDKENYKEVLVTLPKKSFSDWLKENSKTFSEENQKEYESKYGSISNNDRNFKSSHFDEPNIVVHLRMNTRTDVDGNKVLFLEEVQSDWGQKGKKEGFDNKSEQRKELERRGVTFNQNGTVSLKSQDEFYEKGETWDLIKKYNDTYTNRSIAPQAPFVMDTNAWTKLGLKVALKEAVAQGVDKIAWTTGEQQNDRYDLSKQVDKVSITNLDSGYEVEVVEKGKNFWVKVASDISAEKLADYVGKELAEKHINSGKDAVQYEGLDLKVGGKGMKGFYGSPTEGSLGIVGNVAKSLFKQEPKTINIKTSDSEANYTWTEDVDGIQHVEYKGVEKEFETEKEAQAYVNEIKSKQTAQHSIDITPEMRSQVEAGQPLFMASKTKQINESIKTLDELSNQIDEAKDTAAAKAAQAAYEAELKKDPRLNFVISNFGTITGQLEKLNLITKKGDC